MYCSILEGKGGIMEKEVIDFAVYLTGHDKETIIQMYKDWLKNGKDRS